MMCDSKKKIWDFMVLKRELLEDDHRTRPAREQHIKKKKQSKGWKYRAPMDFGPYDGSKVLRKLKQEA